MFYIVEHNFKMSLAYVDYRVYFSTLTRNPFKNPITYKKRKPEVQQCKLITMFKPFLWHSTGSDDAFFSKVLYK